MMTIATNLRRRLKALRANQSGVTAVELAVLGPVFLTLLLGVFQVSIWLQNHNAIRSVSQDSGRAVMVAYQNNNDLTDEQIQGIVIAQAINVPYMLDSERLNVTVNRLNTSRVTGTTEIEIDIQYTLESYIPLMPDFANTVSYERPVFVVPQPITTGGEGT